MADRPADQTSMTIPAERSGRRGRSRAVPRGYLPFPQFYGWPTRMVSRMSSRLRADESIAGREAFVAFLTRFTEDYCQRGEEWENPTLEQFLKALAAWVADAAPSRYERYQGETLPPVATGRTSLGKTQFTKIPDKTQGKKKQPLTIKPPTSEDSWAGGLSLWTPIGGQAAGVSDPSMRKSRDRTIRRRRSRRPGGTGRRCPGPRP
ncbi:DUF7660 family protein [Streptomyces mirabilis]